MTDPVPRRVTRLILSALEGNQAVERFINFEEPQFEVDVDVLQRTTPDANQARVRLFNLGPATRGWLQRTVQASQRAVNSNLGKSGSKPAPRVLTDSGIVTNPLFAVRKDVFAQLEMGLDRRTGVFFEGSCQRVRDTKAGPNWVTDISMGDGLATMMGSAVLREFAPGTRVLEVVRHLVEVMALDSSQLTTANFNRLLGTNSQTFPKGLTAVGPAKFYLDQILALMDVDYFVDFGVFYITKRGEPLPDPEVFISPDTGLVDRPAVTEGGGAMIRTLLRNDIRVGRQVRLDSEDVRGVYRAEVVRHRSNNRRGVSNSFVQLRQIEPVLAGAA